MAPHSPEPDIRLAEVGPGPAFPQVGGLELIEPEGDRPLDSEPGFAWHGTGSETEEQQGDTQLWQGIFHNGSQ